MKHFPFVLGRGKPYFAGARPSLRLVAADLVGEDTVRLTTSLPDRGQPRELQVRQFTDGRRSLERPGP